jgi:hypothetical protein
MDLNDMSDRSFSLFQKKRIALLIDEGFALTGLHTGRNFFLRAEVAFRHPFLFLIIIAQGPIRADEETRSASHARVRIVDHSTSLSHEGQTSAHTSFDAGSRHTVLTFPDPGGPPGEGDLQPLPWLLIRRNFPRIRNAEGVHLTGQSTGLA